MAKNIYITSSGDEIKLLPISIQQLAYVQQAAQKEAEAKFGKLEPPTYEVPILGGGVEVHEHDEQTVEGDNDTPPDPEARAALFAYRENQRQIAQFVNTRAADFILANAVDVTLPEDDKWIKRQKYFGIEVPEDDEMALLIHYIKTEIVRSVDDVRGITARAQELTGISPEQLEAARATFPGSLADI